MLGKIGGIALQSFKDLVVWQKSQDLVLDIYRAFDSCRDYGFRDQIQRATVSIANNIAEGYGRRSDKALSNFLTISRGSAAEVESMILLAVKLDYLTPENQKQLLKQLDEISKLLTAFITKLGFRS